MNEYLIGDFILAAIWLATFFIRKDLRRPILWGSFVHVIILTTGFLLLKVGSLFFYLGEPLNPGYWHPQTLFNLSEITGGRLGIEDILFCFFIGGIAIFVYEFFTRKRIVKSKRSTHHHSRAIIIAIVGAITYQYIFRTNQIYGLILFGFLGAFYICIVRRDLIVHSLFGGAIFTGLYFLGFSIFNLIFPDFIDSFYNLKNLSGIAINDIPLEEFMYALSFGMLWAPMYEYYFGYRDADI